MARSRAASCVPVRPGVGAREREVDLGALRRQSHRLLELPDARVELAEDFDQHAAVSVPGGEQARREFGRALGRRAWAWGILAAG